MDKTTKQTLAASAAIGTLLLIGGGLTGLGDEPKAKPKTETAQPKPPAASSSEKPTVKPAPGVEVHESSKSDDDGSSERQRVAAEVAQEFREGFGPESGYVPVWARSPTDDAPLKIRFADDLDPWDNSLQVRTDLPTNTEDQARRIAEAVLLIGFPKGLCKVDVMSAEGARLIEHESQGPGC